MSERTSGIEFVAYITTQRERLLGGSGLMLHAQTEEESKQLSVDIAKALKCDVVELKCGDYLLISVPK